MKTLNKAIVVAAMVSGLLLSGSAFGKNDHEKGDGLTLNYTWESVLLCGARFGTVDPDVVNEGTAAMSWSGETTTGEFTNNIKFLSNSGGSLSVIPTLVLDPNYVGEAANQDNYSFIVTGGPNLTNVLATPAFDTATTIPNTTSAGGHGYKFKLEADSAVIDRAAQPYGTFTNTVTLTISCL